MSVRLIEVFVLREEDDTGDDPSIANNITAAGPAPNRLRGSKAMDFFDPDDAKSDRMAALRARVAATKGGTVPLRRAPVSDPGKIVKDLLAAAPEGLTQPQVMLGLARALNPGYREPTLRQAGYILQGYRSRSGWDLGQFLGRAATQDPQGRWRLR